MEDFFKQATNIKLEPAKKDRMAQELLIFMQKHPVKPVRTNFFAGFAWQRTASFSMVSLVALLLVGGAVGAQASQALPGDFLYPFKIGVNENVAQVLAFSKQAKLKVNIQLAETRLQEIEQLSVKGNVSAAAEMQITTSFKKHAQKASDYIKKQIDKPDQVQGDAQLQATASNFETSLQAHAQIIDQLEKRNPEAAGEPATKPLVQDIKKAVSDVIDLQVKAEKKHQEKVENSSDLNTKNNINNLLK